MTIYTDEGEPIICNCGGEVDKIINNITTYYYDKTEWMEYTTPEQEYVTFQCSECGKYLSYEDQGVIAQ